MQETRLYDIAEVCQMLGTTSRTLRFYEDKGIITSTTTGISVRRKYTEEQVSHIRNVLVFRTLGLSLKTISDIQNGKTDLKDAVCSKRAEICAAIDSRMQEIDLLNEALFALKASKNIFVEDWKISPTAKSKEIEIAKLCTAAILNNNDEILYKHFSSRLIQYMPKDVYTVARNDTLTPLGDYICTEQITVDKKYQNKLYSKVKFLNLGLKITFVFHGGKIDGLWLGYYDITQRG